MSRSVARSVPWALPWALWLAALLCAGPALARDGRAVYENACRKCHRTGTDEAPIMGDKAAWAKIVTKPAEELYRSVIEGKGEMDPRANQPSLTDEEIQAAVHYMLDAVK